MKKVTIYKYSGYRHNRYDGFNCSHGVLMALGGYDDEEAVMEFEQNWNNGEYLNDENFYIECLQSLDGIDFDDIRELEIDETFTHKEFWGETPIYFEFVRTNDRLICNANNKFEFEIEIPA